MNTLPALLRMMCALCAALALLASAAFANRDGSTDRPGLDYNTFELSAPNPDLCEAACKKDGKCRAWTYSWPGAKGPKAQCALKTGVPPKRSDTCCISGVLSTSSPVTRTDDPAPQPPADALAGSRPQPPEKTEKTTAKSKPAPDPAPRTSRADDTAPPLPQSQPDRPDPADSTVVANEPDAGLESASEQAARPAEPEADRRIAAVRPRQRPDDLSGQSDVTGSDTTENEPANELGPENANEPEQVIDPAKIAACRDYASTAVLQNSRNREMRCGLRGERWGYSYQAYYNYCMKSPPSAYNAARQARDVELARCDRRLASRGDDDFTDNTDRVDDGFLPDVSDIFPADRRTARFCRKYAVQATRQSREAIFNDCGFGGRNWSTRHVVHMDVCHDIGTRNAAKLLRQRARRLSNCRKQTRNTGRVAGFGGGYCDRYAARAVRQFRSARDLDCGFSGPRWSGSFAGHRRWCQGVPRFRSRAEYRARRRLLAQCR